MGSVEIHILGQKYIVRGDENPEYIRQLADFLNTKLQEVYAISPNITPLKATILTALNIADELHKVKREYISASQSIKSMQQKAETLIGLLDQTEE